MSNVAWFVLGFCVVLCVVSISDTIVCCKAAVT